MNREKEKTKLPERVRIRWCLGNQQAWTPLNEGEKKGTNWGKLAVSKGNKRRVHGRSRKTKHRRVL